MGPNWDTEGSSEPQGTPFHCGDGGTREEIFLGVCGVSLFGNIRNLTGHSPGQCPEWFCLSREVGAEDPQTSFPLSAIIL